MRGTDVAGHFKVIAMLIVLVAYFSRCLLIYLRIASLSHVTRLHVPLSNLINGHVRDQDTSKGNIISRQSEGVVSIVLQAVDNQ